MTEIIHLPVLSKAELLAANKEAMEGEFSSYCRQDALEEFLQEGNVHPVTGHSLDHEGHMVCRILAGPDDVIFVALTQARYHSLPTAPVDMVIFGAMLEASEQSKH